jgi:hypothetical protein
MARTATAPRPSTPEQDHAAERNECDQVVPPAEARVMKAPATPDGQLGLQIAQQGVDTGHPEGDPEHRRNLKAAVLDCWVRRLD